MGTAVQSIKVSRRLERQKTGFFNKAVLASISIEVHLMIPSRVR